MAEIKGEIKNDGSAALDFNSNLLPSIGGLIRKTLNTNGDEAAIFNADEINASLEKAAGIKSVKLKAAKADGLNGPIVIEKIDALLNGRAQNFINWKSSTSASNGSFDLLLSRESGPVLLAQISPELSDYISSIMAPIATGEILTTKEYINLVTDIYGKKMADEISGAFFNVSLIFPANVRRVTGGTAKGRTVTFNIPLCDILVLETPLTLKVEW